MRFRPWIPLACGWVVCLAALSVVPTGSFAQDIVAPVVPIGNPGPGPYPIGHGWGFWHRPVFPRTYSYQYAPWFNQPRHTRFVAPDGRKYWRTTVRGLPMGTPWPSF
jgi:hypothetical protein